MNVSGAGGAGAPQKSGGGGAAEAGVAAAGGVVGGIVDMVSQQISHRQSMIDKDTASRTGLINQSTEGTSNRTASQLKANSEASKELGKSLL